MKTIQFHAFGGPDVPALEEVPIPQAGPGEVLIKVESASVNYADILRRRNGPYPHPTHLPATPGIEVAGTVAAVGDEVAGVSPGRRVFAVLPGALGGYAEYALARKEAVIPPGAAGGVGSLAVQIAKVLGAGMVIGIASSEARRAHALSIGADHVIDSNRAGWSAECGR